jgi:hypothetical protein
MSQSMHRGYRCPWVARPITRKRINLIHVSDRTTERPSERLAEGTFGREISREKDIYVSIDASWIVVEDNLRIGISARRPLSRRAKHMQYTYIKHLRHAYVSPTH